VVSTSDEGNRLWLVISFHVLSPSATTQSDIWERLCHWLNRRRKCWGKSLGKIHTVHMHRSGNTNHQRHNLDKGRLCDSCHSKFISSSNFGSSECDWRCLHNDMYRSSSDLCVVCHWQWGLYIIPESRSSRFITLMFYSSLSVINKPVKPNIKTHTLTQSSHGIRV
jgi:hypothetical protein